MRTISGIDDIVFVHASGFIGGARSYENALKMARLSLEWYISIILNKSMNLSLLSNEIS